MNSPTYSLYPSLLDSFTYMRSCEGDMYVAKERELIDRINRVPMPPTSAMEFGTAFGDMCDRALFDYETKDTVIESATPIVLRRPETGFQWNVDRALVAATVQHLRAHGVQLRQVFTSADFDLGNCRVRLYGFIDYVCNSEVIDLKTTGTFSPSKHRDGWQRHIYPLCLHESGDLLGVRNFTFVNVLTSVTTVVCGDVFDESYAVDIEASRRQTMEFIQLEFIPWLDNRAHLIDPKAKIWQ